MVMWSYCNNNYNVYTYSETAYLCNGYRVSLEGYTAYNGNTGYS
jgi:hypothetical protein